MKIIITMKTGKKHHISNIVGFDSFEAFCKHVLNTPWNGWGKLLIQTSEIESIEMVDKKEYSL